MNNNDSVNLKKRNVFSIFIFILFHFFLTGHVGLVGILTFVNEIINLQMFWFRVLRGGLSFNMLLDTTGTLKIIASGMQRFV